MTWHDTTSYHVPSLPSQRHAPHLLVRERASHHSVVVVVRVHAPQVAAAQQGQLRDLPDGRCDVVEPFVAATVTATIITVARPLLLLLQAQQEG
eukprot:CAMPEP_0197581722 /NCGR_PEP_ID=MMETSP1326-20131121/5144_2 /TAXON_ID=1155430 /ORGANISM="Genus nov. species nov., Strain RCC2288" /LENGTH=93 /DNA_ID=CAMNT_0043145667 /DNA_START=300 /DNA_END=577 /DNA_ORIENTATION=-